MPNRPPAIEADYEDRIAASRRGCAVFGALLKARASPRLHAGCGRSHPMSKAPIVSVKEVFKSKDKLVAAVQSLASSELWLDRLNAVKGLARISNRKLLRLHDLLSFAKDKFGTRAKLVDSILDLEQKSKDQGLRTRTEIERPGSSQ
jgi:hypothetical protein